MNTTQKRLIALKGQREGENKVNRGKEGVLMLITENHLEGIALTIIILYGLDLAGLNQGGLEGNWI